MKRRSWALVALSLAGAAWNASFAEEPSLRDARAGDRSAVRRAADFFSKGGRATTEDAATEEAPSSAARPLKTTAKPSAQTASSAGGRTAAFRPASEPFDARLRPKPPATTSTTDSEPMEEDVFGPSETAPQAPLRPRVNAAAILPIGADGERLVHGTLARTPSGAPLQRGLSEDEEQGRVVQVRNAARGDGAAIQTVQATNEDENPFVPVEDFLKKPPSKPKKPLAPLPAERSVGMPRNTGNSPPASTLPTSGIGRGMTETVRATAPSKSLPRTEIDSDILPFADSEKAARPAVDDQEPPRVTVRWVKRNDINVGQPCECDLIVRNHGGKTANDVTVEAFFPKTVRLTNSSPEPTEVTDHLSWTFPTIDPGQEKTIRIGLVPSKRGEMATTAHVRFTGSADGAFTVTEPMLEVHVRGPKEVLVGDPASHIIMVSNPGTGVANNVVVEATIPKGLEHPRGEKLVMEVGSLGAGESRTVRLSLSAVAGGQHQVEVVARADADLTQTAVAEVVVVAPSLKMALDGPSLRYIGRTAQYQLILLNDGAAPSNNVRVMHKIPEGFRFVRADKGGKYEETAQTVSWFVGRIDPGQNATVKVELAPTQLGTFEHRAAAVSEQGTKADATIETVVDGTAAVQLEVVEQSDPVEVDSEAVYEIRLRNAGSKAAQNVGISCELASSVQLVNASGPTDYLAENGLVIFKSLPQLPAGKTATYRVSVKGTQEGSHRFRVRLASDSITEPLISEELTKFYAE